MSKKRFTLETVFKTIDQMTKPIVKMERTTSRFLKSMNRGVRNVNRRLTRMVGKLRDGARTGAIALTILAAGIGNVLAVGAKFEQNIVNAAAKFPGEIRKGTAAYLELEKAARGVGRTTEFTATQSAEALNFLAMAGFNAQGAVRALPGVVNLATVAQTDLALATDIATDSLGAFNLLSKDAEQQQKNLTRITDVFAKTTTSANLSIVEMFEAIKDGAPVGVAAGQSLETIATLTAKMADAGIKGTRAGTGLKRIFLALNAPTSEAAKLFKQLGIETVGSNGKIRDALDVFEDFSKATKKLTQEQQLKVFDRIFGKIPIAAAINLTNAAGSMKEYRKQLIGATGETKRMSDVMRNTVIGRWNALQAAIESVKISIFSMNEGPLSETIDQMTEWVRVNEKLIATKIGNFIKSIFENRVEIFNTVKMLGKLVATLITLSIVAKAFAVVMGIVNIVMLANPIGLIIVAIGLLVAAVASAIIWWDELKETFMKFPAPVKAAIAVLAGPIGWLLSAASLIGDSWESVLESLTNIFERMKGMVQSFVNFHTAPIRLIADLIGGDDDETNGTPAQRNMVSPQERVTKSLQETITSSSTEVTIKDETGRAEVTKGKTSDTLTLLNSGAF